MKHLSAIGVQQVLPMTFPIGYHSLHPDASMNFQMNRFYGSVGEPDMLDEMRMAAPRIVTYADWKREFVVLAERASQQGHDHCQLGNQGLALKTIVNWLDSMLPESADPLVPSTGVRQ